MRAGARIERDFWFIASRLQFAKNLICPNTYTMNDTRKHPHRIDTIHTFTSFFGGRRQFVCLFFVGVRSLWSFEWVIDYSSGKNIFYTV